MIHTAKVITLHLLYKARKEKTEHAEEDHLQTAGLTALMHAIWVYEGGQ